MILGHYRLELRTGSRRAFRDGLHVYKTDGRTVYIWGKLSLSIEHLDLPVVPVCAQCDSIDVGETWAEVTVCSDCRSVEGGYRYLTVREYESL